MMPEADEVLNKADSNQDLTRRRFWPVSRGRSLLTPIKSKASLYINGKTTPKAALRD